MEKRQFTEVEETQIAVTAELKKRLFIQVGEGLGVRFTHATEKIQKIAKYCFYVKFENNISIFYLHDKSFHK